MRPQKLEQRNNLPSLGRAYEELNRNRTNRPRNRVSTLEGLVELGGPFTKGIFLDNDPGHRAAVQNACRHAMTVIPVPETKDFEPSVRIASPEYEEFVSKLSPEGKDAANVLSRICLVAGDGLELLDSGSGIQPAQVAEVNAWVERESASPGNRLVAIFDFDRTISVMEGGFFLDDSVFEMKKSIVEQLGGLEDLARFASGLTGKGFAEYLAGGQERFAMLQGMFDFLYHHNVRVILLTNNEGCIKARTLFHELMMSYTRNRPVEILCGIEFEGNKGAAILGKPTDTGDLKALREMCMVRGGYRKTRKTRKMKKQKQNPRTRSHR